MYQTLDGKTERHPADCFAKDSICDCGYEKWVIEPGRIDYFLQRRLTTSYYTSGVLLAKYASRSEATGQASKARIKKPCGSDEVSIDNSHLRFGNEIRLVARKRKNFTISAGIERDTIRLLLKGIDEKVMKSYALGMDAPMSTKDPEGISQLIDKAIFTETSLKRTSSIGHLRLGIKFEEVSSVETTAPESVRNLLFNVVLGLTNAAPKGLKLISLQENDGILFEIDNQRFEYRKKYDLCESDGVIQKISGDWLVTDFTNE